VRVGARHGNEQVDWTRAGRQGRKLGASAKREGPGTLSGVVRVVPAGPWSRHVPLTCAVPRPSVGTAAASQAARKSSTIARTVLGTLVPARFR